MREATVGRWLLIGAGVIVLATLAGAIAVMGLPSSQRDVRLDQRRVQDLQRITRLIDLHVERDRALPPDLDTLARQPGRQVSIVDPVDGSAYAYEITDERAYRLCAVFATDTATTTGFHGAPVADEWLHGARRQCFDRKVRARTKGGVTEE